MDETSSNREKAEKAFRDWQDGTGFIGSITDLLADGLRWTIVGRSRAAKTYDGKDQFIGEVLDQDVALLDHERVEHRLVDREAQRAPQALRLGIGSACAAQGAREAIPAPPAREGGVRAKRFARTPRTGR